MNYSLFETYFDYGASSVEYCIDEKGPYIVKRKYDIIFHGPGDHIGEPGSVISRSEKRITFSDLKTAAHQYRHPEYTNINEKNWKFLVEKNR